MAIIILILGTGLLYIGAEVLVKGSTNVALRVGVKPIIVGLTVVAFGTSSPELLVSMHSAWTGVAPLAVGNVIGSNICNLALILGIAVLVRPIKIERKIILKDVLIMVIISVLLVVFIIDSPDRTIARWEGAVLFLAFIAYIASTVIVARRDKKAVENFVDIPKPNFTFRVWVDILLILVGLVALVFGSNLFVRGAIDIARQLGVSEALIGLTIVALGTSLPELATTVVAALRNENDLGFGNAVGSNIFNVLLVVGLTSTMIPLTTTGIHTFDLVYMLLVSFIIFPMAWTQYSISRREGVVLILLYISYIVFKSQGF